nr:glycosyltransferase family 4 protein [Salinibacter ruber]
MCEAFEEIGHDVSLVCGTGPLQSGNIHKFYDVKACFPISRLSSLEWGLKGRKYLFAIHVSFYLARIQPDLVYGRCRHSCAIAALLGYPVVHDAHSIPPESRNLTSALLRWLLTRTKVRRLVVNTQALRQVYEDRFDIRSEIRVAHNGATDPPDDAYVPKELCATTKQDIQVGYVGTLKPGKGMKIIEEIAPECSWAQFHVVGGNENQVDYWRDRLSSVDNVVLHGFVPHRETHAYRQHCDVLIAPYQREVLLDGGLNIADWTSPVKVFEYMAAEKPIVCSSLPSLREVVTHEENALLCAPDEPKSWVRALCRLKNDQMLRRELAQRARLDYERNYSWRARAEKVLEGI